MDYFAEVIREVDAELKDKIIKLMAENNNLSQETAEAPTLKEGGQILAGIPTPAMDIGDDQPKRGRYVELLSLAKDTIGYIEVHGVEKTEWYMFMEMLTTLWGMKK